MKSLLSHALLISALSLTAVAPPPLEKYLKPSADPYLDAKEVSKAWKNPAAEFGQPKSSLSNGQGKRTTQEYRLDSTPYEIESIETIAATTNWKAHARKALEIDANNKADIGFPDLLKKAMKPLLDDPRNPKTFILRDVGGTLRVETNYGGENNFFLRIYVPDGHTGERRFEVKGILMTGREEDGFEPPYSLDLKSLFKGGKASGWRNVLWEVSL